VQPERRKKKKKEEKKASLERKGYISSIDEGAGVATSSEVKGFPHLGDPEGPRIQRESSSKGVLGGKSQSQVREDGGDFFIPSNVARSLYYFLFQ